MNRSRASHAWDLFDLYTDLECFLGDRVREHSTEPRGFDDEGSLVYITRDTLLWEVLMEYFERDFDAQQTMAALCHMYGIENIYE